MTKPSAVWSAGIMTEVLQSVAKPATRVAFGSSSTTIFILLLAVIVDWLGILCLWHAGSELWVCQLK